jgi:hypothetical protein
MSKAETVKTFNDIVESFLVQYSKYLGTSYHHYFCKLAKMNALLPIQHFIFYGLPLQSQIIARDESYFTNLDNHKDNEHIKEESKFIEIMRLNGVFEQLDKTEKDGVWDYLHAMVEFAIKYLQIK